MFTQTGLKRQQAGTLKIACLFASVMAYSPARIAAMDTPEYEAELARLTTQRRQDELQFKVSAIDLDARAANTVQQQTELEQQRSALATSIDGLSRLITQAEILLENNGPNQPTTPKDFFQNLAEQLRQRHPLPPLLDKTEQLYCAETPGQAKHYLDQFFGISPAANEWPDEWLGSAHKPPELHAASMDIILATLRRTAERFPVLRQHVERVALQWDYCPLLEQGQFYNLQIPEHHLLRSKASLQSPLAWQGFRQWGFLGSAEERQQRFVPTLLSDITIAPYAYQVFLHQAYRQHCFPHPVTGELYTEADAEKNSLRSLFPPPPEEAGSEFPYQWHPFCEIPKVGFQPRPAWPKAALLKASMRLAHLQKAVETNQTRLQTLTAQKQELKKKQQQSTQKLEESIRELEQKRQEQLQQRAEAERIAAEKAEQAAQAALKEKQARETAATEKIKKLEAAVAEYNRQKKLLEAAAQLKKQQAEQKKAEQQRKLEQARLAEETARQKKRAAQAKQAEKQAEQQRWQEAQRQLAAEKALQQQNRDFAHMKNPPSKMVVVPVASGNGASFVDLRHLNAGKNKKESSSIASKLNISGTYSLNMPVSGARPSINGSLTLSPIESIFMTMGGSFKNNQFTYSWSAGYSDWRPGTVSAQLNNWGPLKKGDGLAFDKAILNIGYKVDSDLLRKKNLAVSLGLSAPVTGKKRTVSATFQWSPKENWYVRTTASQSLDGGPTKWNYGFGYYDWRPDAWRVEYSNYSGDRYPFENIEKGNLTISRGWKF